MTTIMQDLIRSLTTNWSVPRRTADSSPSIPDFEVGCTFDAPEASLLVSELPNDLADFWKVCGSARLFEDRKYGQWGLAILSAHESSAQTARFQSRRAKDFVVGDRVVGQFFGDSDLLIIRCDANAPDFGRVLIGHPIDGRDEWEVVGDSFSEFLKQYVATEGNKFWE
jgi:hypothetical protein